jgi:anti-sigma regulatory factor (Ser/Thr protein kinase)
VLPLWGTHDLVESAQLLVSELVTNAVQHAGGTESVELEIVRHSTGVRLALADGSTVAPIARELRVDAPSGRGIYIIKQLATRWGTEHRHGGKQVWAELDQSE